MRIRTAIFTVYVAASGLGFVVLMAMVLRDVRTRYIESMRRTLGDTAAFLAVFASQGAEDGADWTQRFAALPPRARLLRVFASDSEGRVTFDSAGGRDVGQVYGWPMRGGGPVASENYSVSNVAMVDDELRVRAAVRRDGRLLGWVGVGRPLATVADAIWHAQREILVSSGLLALVMIGAGWWIASRLTRSIERLTAYVEALRDGRNAIPPASRAREVAALARAFEEMRRTLEGKAQVERYTQALAHEFKAPLSAIRGAAELLGEEMPRTERTRFIANVRAESERMQRIVDRLLQLSALEAQGTAGEFAEIDLPDVVREAVAAAQHAAGQRNIVVEFVESDPARVRGDRDLLLQALNNLIQNAMEFSPAGGRVNVKVVRRERRAAIAVEDDGPGLPAFAQEKVFDRFYSLPRPGSGRKSSGLGLSIVREIARLHGGEAALANRGERGARAELVLPAA